MENKRKIILISSVAISLVLILTIVLCLVFLLPTKVNIESDKSVYIHRISTENDFYNPNITTDGVKIEKEGINDLNELLSSYNLYNPPLVNNVVEDISEDIFIRVYDSKGTLVLTYHFCSNGKASITKYDKKVSTTKEYNVNHNKEASKELINAIISKYFNE